MQWSQTIPPRQIKPLQSLLSEFAKTERLKNDGIQLPLF